jgi:hypothetical protein
MHSKKAGVSGPGLVPSVEVMPFSIGVMSKSGAASSAADRWCKLAALWRGRTSRQGTDEEPVTRVLKAY